MHLLSRFLQPSLYKRFFRKMPVYKKTNKGMEELLARRPGIDPRLFNVLVMVDGVRDSPEIVQMAKDAGLPADALEILKHGGYLEQKFRGSPSPARPSSPPPQPPPPAPAPEAGRKASKRVDESARFKGFQDLYGYLVEQTKALLGLRGFGFQLRIERATTLAELQGLLAPLSEAIAKKQGLDVAQTFKREGELLALTALAEQQYAGTQAGSKRS